jgi:hypothetical protein
MMAGVLRSLELCGFLLSGQLPRVLEGFEPASTEAHHVPLYHDNRRRLGEHRQSATFEIVGPGPRTREAGHELHYSANPAPLLQVLEYRLTLFPQAVSGSTTRRRPRLSYSHETTARE